jgi:peroxiredoxin Q/BCP
MTISTSESATAHEAATKIGELSVGAEAPAFELLGDDDKLHTLREFAGQRVVLYFYPKDSTPGCTQEACDFRDSMAALKGRGLVIGVSPDSVESHRKFKAKYELPFLLLSDPGATLAQRYGAWGEKNMYGKKSTGLIRSTFVIGPTGRIESIYRRVSVKGHVQKVLDKLGT